MARLEQWSTHKVKKCNISQGKISVFDVPDGARNKSSVVNNINMTFSQPEKTTKFDYYSLPN